MKRFKNHRPLMRTSVLATVVAAVGFAAPLPARAADEVTHDRLLNADKEPGNWLLHHKNFSATRFSSLKDINRDNVKNLKVAWTMHLGGVEGGGIWTHGGLEGTPIVENGFMYVTDGWGSVYKIDTHGGQGILVWKMDPKTDHDWAGAVACCGVIPAQGASSSQLSRSARISSAPRAARTAARTARVSASRSVP